MASVRIQNRFDINNISEEDAKNLALLDKELNDKFLAFHQAFGPTHRYSVTVCNKKHPEKLLANTPLVNHEFKSRDIYWCLPVPGKPYEFNEKRVLVKYTTMPYRVVETVGSKFYDEKALEFPVAKSYSKLEVYQYSDQYASLPYAVRSETPIKSITSKNFSLNGFCRDHYFLSVIRGQCTKWAKLDRQFAKVFEATDKLENDIKTQLSKKDYIKQRIFEVKKVRTKRSRALLFYYHGLLRATEILEKKLAEMAE